MKKQLLDFPRGRHDDCVDALTYLPQLLHWRANDPEPKKLTPEEIWGYNDLEETEEAAAMAHLRVQAWQERGGYFPR